LLVVAKTHNPSSNDYWNEKQTILLFIRSGA